MKFVESYNDVLVRLSKERVSRIIQNHPEMSTIIIEIVETLQQPNYVFAGKNGEQIATKEYPNYHIVVVYKVISSENSFVITAFLTTQIRCYLKKQILWKKK